MSEEPEQIVVARLISSLLAAGDVETAEQKFAVLRETAPESLLLEIEGLFGEFYLSNGNFVDAEPLLLCAFNYSETHPEHRFHVLHSLGHSISHLYETWGRPDERLRHFPRTDAKHAHSDKDPQVARRLAEINQSLGDLDEAIINLERSYQMPGNRNVDMALALERLFKRTRQKDRLARLYVEKMREEALSIRCYLEIGDFEAALKMIEQQIAEKDIRKQTMDKRHSGCFPLAPQYSYYMYELANCLLDGYGEYKRAIDAIENGIKANCRVPMSTPLEKVPDSFGMPEENLQTSELVTLLISCDGAGELERADKYRVRLAKRLSEKNQTYDQAVTAINRHAMTRAEQVDLMELVAITHDGFFDSWLLKRAKAIRTSFGITDHEAIRRTFKFLCQSENRDEDEREGNALSRIDWLKKIGASEAEIAVAELEYGEMLFQRKEYFAARRFFIPLLVRLTTENQLRARQRIIDCCRAMDHYQDAIEHLERLRDSYSEDSKAWTHATLEQAVFLDLLGRHDEALSFYKQVGRIDDDSKDDLTAPLRRATERAVARKQLAIAKLLKDRLRIISAG